MTKRIRPSFLPQEDAIMLAQLTLHEELHQLLKHALLTPVFQPISALDTLRILGYEALIRGPQHSALPTPDRLFEVARASRQSAASEYACRAVSCEPFVARDLP